MNKYRLVGMVAALGVLGAGGVAYAAIPDPQGVINACYKKGGLLQEPGALRVSDTGCAARNSHSPGHSAVQPAHRESRARKA